MSAEIVTKILDLGATAALAAFILYGLYRITLNFGNRFIDAQNRQAEALTSQAKSMETLAEQLRDYITRDNSEHREMLVLLRFIAQRQNELDEVRIEHQRRFKAQAHPGCPSPAPQDGVSGPA